MNKECNICKRQLPLSEFYIKNNGLHGRNSYCKQCQKIKEEAKKEVIKKKVEEGNYPKLKKCSKCHQLIDIDNFRLDLSKSDGHYSSCNKCNERRLQNYRDLNKDTIRVSQKKAYKRNFKYYQKYKHLHYLKHKDHYNKKSIEYYFKNINEIKQKNKKYREKIKKLNILERRKLIEKECQHCKNTLPVSEFEFSKQGEFIYSSICKKCSLQSKMDQKKKKNKRSLDYYYSNKEEISSKNYERKKERMRNNHSFKLKEVLSHRIRMAIRNRRGKKSLKTLELLGCTIEEAREHIESLFQKGMTWDNYGVKGWQIDHIIPCANFDLTKVEAQKECFNYKNLQPMWAKHNLRKGKKIELPPSSPNT